MTFYDRCIYYMLRAFKYRLYPNKTQEVLLNKNIGCCRFIYNWALEQKQKAWATEKKKLTAFDLQRLLVDLKKKDETAFLAEVGAQTLQGSIADLDTAFVNFFRKTSKYPKFKRKFGPRQRFSSFQGVKIDFDRSRIKMVVHGWIKIAVDDRRFDGQIKRATVSREPTDKWFVSVLVDDKVELPAVSDATDLTGVDLGLTNFITTSKGEKVENPRFLKRGLKPLRRAQRIASRRVKGSRRKDKARAKVAMIYERIQNRRSDFLHKLSRKLTDENQGLAFEDLNVSGMQKNRGLARSVSDAGWSELVRQCKYKCAWAGKPFIQIGRFEPSSKLCTCGVVNRELALADRTWTCQACGKTHDRDILAAQNIRSMALHPQTLLRAGSPEVTLVETV
jgi:putative transposase